jgi:hypothetical protein
MLSVIESPSVALALMLLTGGDSHDRSGADGPVAARSLAGAPFLALSARPSVTAATGYSNRHLAKDPRPA